MTPAPKKRRRSGPSGPSIPTEQRKAKPVNITLPPPVREHLDALQAADGVTRSAMVAGLIEDEWERRELERDGEARVAEVRARNKRARS